MKTKWTTVADITRLVAWGDTLVCPAVIGACGPSEKVPGAFWFRESTSSEPGYATSLTYAKELLLGLCKSWIELNSNAPHEHHEVESSAA